jgi:hypothetical protein
LALRVKQETTDALEIEGKAMGVSLNAIANIIFEEYLEVHIPAKKAGFVYTPKSMLKELLKELPEENIPLIAKTILPGLESMIFMSHRPLDSNAMLMTIVSLARHSGYACNDMLVEDGSRGVTLVHDMGINYSLLMKACLEQAVDHKGESSVRFTISATRLTMNLRDSG